MSTATPETPANPATPPTARQERAAANKLARQVRANEARARKLHAIASRRAEANGLSKADFIAQIVKGKYRPITAEDIAEEPDPQVEAEKAAS